MTFKMSRGIVHCLLGYYPLLPLVFVLFPIPLQFPTLAQDCLLNEGHAETPDFPVSSVASSSCLCHEKSVIEALLYSFFFCRLIAGGCEGVLCCFNGFFF